MTQTPEHETTTPTSAEEALANATNDASLTRSLARSEEIRADLDVNPGRYRMLTGVRPTGNMHLGHYFGTMHSWRRIQDLGVDTWILVADYQVITDRDGVGPIRERVLSLVADTLAVGVDPERSTVFAHSAVPAANQLMLPFLSLVTESELHRNPTVKAELEATDGRAMTGLMLTYPVHQAADILFCQANLVPVGKDQLPHLEQARLIAQRFDKRYGRADRKHPVFRRPEALLSETPLLLGLDGEKMSKSRHNTIELRMSADETAKALRKAKTDSDRVITYDPVGRPEVSNLLMLASLCGAGAPEEVAERIGDGGAGALKRLTAEAVNEFFAPVRARRAELAANEDYLREVLHAGNARACEVATATLEDVRRAMHMDY
ncbi:MULTISPECIES: tryptophan--tRNA ligase [unclassified Actinomyces]|uniref:tryptophan--tRNA ligase n=1 Tax=unclassified Actinomyces TaxID=2609248 RepID=UPI00201787B7|nr:MULTISPECIES: tryptophan--tRNA ligase [unclassified Actinomyces]MCL3778080.1 tryptophan--tRNA ligase [Actinomyces sp. AC-20-1]MCL3790485.1 tryptophan--tRNA ligase [Actinomyces sp. 187325]MCL3792782.1 tryptophan--tRNA ligase [Actinomyces sp. 186855]MCL3795251.1 tryptophan--tRNA ligase [Actinomyces sp. 217892]